MPGEESFLSQIPTSVCSASSSKIKPNYHPGIDISLILFLHPDYQVYIKVNVINSAEPNHLELARFDAQPFSRQLRMDAAVTDLLAEPSRSTRAAKAPHGVGGGTPTAGGHLPLSTQGLSVLGEKR